MKGKNKTRNKKILSALLICVIAISTLMFMKKKPTFAAEATLLNTYGSTLGHVGNCVSLSQLQNASTLAQIKSQYNSITLENEMKPDYLLGSSASLISVSQAKNLGYYIPSGYTESYVPRINFNTVDAVLKICYENGLGVRAHTLVWHSQTPAWFFKTGYSSNNGFVNQSTMDSRMEYYIKSVMNHVYSSKYGSCVYAWDVVNEYLHASNSGWLNIYGGVNTNPQFVKKAFQFAHESLEQYGLTNSVSLFYNDYNTYMEANDIITMIKYINSSKKICNGVGMQSHLDTSYPSAAQFKTTVQQFVNAGLEVQITEFDVTNSNANTQANYCYSIMKGVLDIKKAGGNITGFTVWGLYDSISWRSSQAPTLHSSLTSPKASYYQVLQAYTDAGYTVGTAPIVKPTTNPTVKPTANPTVNPTVEPTVTTKEPILSDLSDGWYYIKNVNAQKYLQVANNQGGNGVNVELGTGTGVKGQKWYLTNLENGYISLKNGQGYMLDVEYGKNVDGANIQTYTANGMDAQIFKLSKTSSKNVYGIVTKCSSGTKGLDAYNWTTMDGTNVCEWTYYGNKNQIWVFESCNANTTSTTTPTAAPVVTATKTWKFSDSGFATITGLTSSTTINDLKLYATSAKPMNIKSDKNSLNGTTYTKCLALGGGGSITEGANASSNTKCYAYQSYLMFKEKYGKNGGSNVHFVNAGMSGTPSSLGMIRYERDVLNKAYSTPDIVFVEFAVNDADDVTNGDAYESLVRNILKENNNPAVILLFSIFESQWNLQERFIPVGNYYNLPMISIKNAIVPEINSGRLTNAQFFSSDGLHPTDYGHKIMADCIINCINQIAYQTKASSDITISSTAKIGKSYEGIKMIDSASNSNGVTISAGGFSTKDTATGNFLFDNTSKFSNTWMHSSYGASTSFTMNVTCKNLLLIYKLSNNYNTGSADIYIDGKFVKTVSGYSSSGWNNPQTIVLMNNTAASSHKVEIKMSYGNTAKEFTILGFGFTK